MFIKALALLVTVLSLSTASAQDSSDELMSVQPSAEQMSASSDIGQCFSLAPLCMYPQHPQCLCDIMLNCFWVCR